MVLTANADITTFTLPESRLYRAQRAWVLFVQGLFAARPVGNYKWSEDPAESEIVISTAHPTEGMGQHVRPLIVVERTSANTAGISRDQTLAQSNFGQEKTFTRLYVFHMQITAVAREGIEAESLLWYVDQMILPFKGQLQRIGRMHHIGTQAAFSAETSHGNLVPGSSVPSWRAVTLSIPCSLQTFVSADSAEDSFQNVLRSVTLQLESD